jgi:hypothetical protein
MPWIKGIDFDKIIYVKKNQANLTEEKQTQLLEEAFAKASKCDLAQFELLLAIAKHVEIKN